MKKKVLKLSLFSTLFLLLFIVVFVVVNLFDAPEPEGLFTIKDLNPATLDCHNGYFQVMAFTYPAKIDIRSKSVCKGIQVFSRPETLVQTSSRFQRLHKKHRDQSKELRIQTTKDAPKALFKLENHQDFTQLILNKASVSNGLEMNAVLIQRYTSLLNTSYVSDFSLPSISYPIPPLITIIKTGKLYTASIVISAIEGDWDTAVDKLLKQLQFFIKLHQNSRILIGKIAWQAISRTTLKALTFLMSRDECPRHLYASVLKRLPPLTEADISLKHAYIHEFLNGVQLIDDLLKSGDTPFQDIGVVSSFLPSTSDWLNFLIKFKIFLNRNRTIGFYLKETRKILNYENRPPYRWEQKLADLIPPDPTSGLFWWFSNPVGKALYAMSYGSYQNTIYKKYELKAIYDMVRLCAEYYMTQTADKSAKEVIQGLGNYKSLDPFSGKPYRFNLKKKRFYSIGTNLKDDSGIDQRGKRQQNLDIVIFCHFKKAPKYTENSETARQ